MLNSSHIIESFSRLGSLFRDASITQLPGHTYKNKQVNRLESSIDEAFYQNPWFIPPFVKFSFSAWADALQEEKISTWLKRYDNPAVMKNSPRNVGIIMAGNIPMVGLHDLLCVLASGNHAIIRLSSSDKILIPAVLDLLCQIDPGFIGKFTFTDQPLKNFDAIIATGSNNSARYFHYYFEKYPHIIRRNRNGTAILTGNETDQSLRKLADDIFMYFGLGCRNVSKIYTPAGFNIQSLFPHFEQYSFLAQSHRYCNNYDYQKSILLINSIDHQDNGFLLFRNNHSLLSPVSVLNTEAYESAASLSEELLVEKENIQCVVSECNDFSSSISFGKSQFPELWDYADEIDTLQFLLNL
jgi:hypothetical protein